MPTVTPSPKVEESFDPEDQTPTRTPVEPGRQRVFTRAEDLILPNLIGHWGRPGVEYAIIPQDHLYDAETTAGWERLAGREQKMFKIEGPKGDVACDLRGRGRPIPGQSLGPKSPLLIDKLVWERTGLKPLTSNIEDTKSDSVSDAGQKPQGASK